MSCRRVLRRRVIQTGTAAASLPRRAPVIELPVFGRYALCLRERCVPLPFLIKQSFFGDIENEKKS